MSQICVCCVFYRQCFIFCLKFVCCPQSVSLNTNVLSFDSNLCLLSTVCVFYSQRFISCKEFVCCPHFVSFIPNVCLLSATYVFYIPCLLLAITLHSVAIITWLLALHRYSVNFMHIQRMCVNLRRSWTMSRSRGLWNLHVDSFDVSFDARGCLERFVAEVTPVPTYFCMYL